MVHLLIPSIINAVGSEKALTEKKSHDDEQRSIFDKYSATERFEDIINTLKAAYFKLELAEKKKDNPDQNLINDLSRQRLYLADIQQRYIESFSIQMMEESLQKELLPELKYLQDKYSNILS